MHFRPDLFVSIIVIFQSIESEYVVDRDCPADCPMKWHNRSNPNQTVAGQCQLIRKTDRCVYHPKAEIEKMVTGNETEERFTARMNVCSARLLYFFPSAYVYTGHLVKTIRFNLSGIVHVQPKEERSPVAIRVEAECMHGTPNEEHCFQKTNALGALVDSTREHWPCRLFDLEHPSDPETFLPSLPLTFGYSCLRAHPATQLRINVTIYPHLCESSFFLTSPYPDWLEPGEEKANKWLPMPFADLNSVEGVLIGFTPPPSYVNLTLIQIEIKAAVGSKIYHKTTILYKPGLTGRMIRNIKMGEYKAYLTPYVTFNGETVGMHSCFVMFKFDDFDRKWGSGQMIGTAEFHNYLPVIIVIVFVVVISVLLCAFVAWLFTKHAKGDSANAVLETEMREMRSPPPRPPAQPSRPKLIIVYSDDHEAHRNVVLALAQFLHSNANVDVLLDEWALERSQQGPFQWYHTALEAADQYLVVFSEGAREIFQGNRLYSLRHWDDWFSPAITVILQQLLTEIRKRSPMDTAPLRRYAWLRMSYSKESCLLPFLRRLPVEQFCLPRDAEQLIEHVQESRPTNFASSPDLTELNSAISAAEQFEARNRDWLSERILKNSNPNLDRISADLEQHLTQRVYATAPTESPEQAINTQKLPPRLRPLNARFSDSEDELQQVALIGQLDDVLLSDSD